jgi:hypothetical protein
MAVGMPHPSRFSIAGSAPRQWSVIDARSGMAASFGGENLAELSEFEAEKFCKLLNELYPADPDAFGVPAFTASATPQNL